MAKVRYRSQFHYSFSGQPVSLRAAVSIGASGAPTIVSGTGMGIDAISRSSAGKYVLTLSQAFHKLMSVHVISNSGSSAPAAPVVCIAADAVSSTPSLTLQMYAPDGITATDPASGEVLLIEVVLDRSSLAS